jgi:hypothetical protein
MRRRAPVRERAIVPAKRPLAKGASARASDPRGAPRHPPRNGQAHQHTSASPPFTTPHAYARADEPSAQGGRSARRNGGWLRGASVGAGDPRWPTRQTAPRAHAKARNPPPTCTNRQTPRASGALSRYAPDWNAAGPRSPRETTKRTNPFSQPAVHQTQQPHKRRRAPGPRRPRGRPCERARGPHQPGTPRPGLRTATNPAAPPHPETTTNPAAPPGQRPRPLVSRNNTRQTAPRAERTPRAPGDDLARQSRVTPWWMCP